MNTHGFETMPGVAGFARAEGGKLALVQRIGGGYSASWGYTVWEGSSCIEGKCNWDWAADDACYHAASALGRLNGGPA